MADVFISNVIIACYASRPTQYILLHYETQNHMDWKDERHYCKLSLMRRTRGTPVVIHQFNPIALMSDAISYRSSPFPDNIDSHRRFTAHFVPWTAACPSSNSQSIHRILPFNNLSNDACEQNLPSAFGVFSPVKVLQPISGLGLKHVHPPNIRLFGAIHGCI